MKPERDGHRWEDWELKFLKQFVELGWDNLMIAEVLKRSGSSVRTKICRAGIHRTEDVILKLNKASLAKAREVRFSPEKEGADVVKTKPNESATVDHCEPIKIG